MADRKSRIKMEPDSKRELFRHLLATVAFRATIAISDAPDKFASFKIDETVRTPAEILAHLGDLIEGSHFLMKGEFVELKSEPLEWKNGVKRFFSAVKNFDSFLASDAELAQSIEKLTQGPLADALTHVGQIILLRRAFGSPVKSASYFEAEITPGKSDFNFDVDS